MYLDFFHVKIVCKNKKGRVLGTRPVVILKRLVVIA